MPLHALILAKSKSNRLPGKNSLDFKGKPMFVENIKKCIRIFDKVYVSSDSQVILDQARAAGAIPIWRPQKLCGDTPNIPVYRHALDKMGECDIVAVQANSPTIKPETILWVKGMMEMGAQEVMTCHPNHSIYGSVWALSHKRLMEYQDFYHPKPDILVVDNSVDIHTWADYEEALKCQ